MVAPPGASFAGDPLLCLHNIPPIPFNTHFSSHVAPLHYHHNIPPPLIHALSRLFCLVGTIGQANNATWSGNGGHNDDYDGYDDGDNDGGDYGEDFCDADNDGLDNDNRGGVTVTEPERVGLFINTDALLRAPRLGDTPSRDTPHR